MIHRYKNNGYNIVLDVNSGSVHVVDKVKSINIQVSKPFKHDVILVHNFVVIKIL